MLKMQSSILSLLALLASNAIAIPRGRGGGGSGSDSGSSDSCSYANTCNTDMVFMYGYRYTSLFTRTELYAQAIVYAIWILVLFGSYLRLKKGHKSYSIQAAHLFFALTFVFLVVRYSLILADVSVLTGYRYESSIIILFWRLAVIILFVALALELELGKLFKLATYSGIGIYASLNLTVIVLDFLLSSKAVHHFREEGEWWLSDRDFSLTMDPEMIKKVRISGRGGNDGLSPYYIRDRFFQISDSAQSFLHDREVVVKVALAADWIAFAIAGLLLGIAVWRLLRRKSMPFRLNLLLVIAAAGPIISTLFQVIVATHYVFHNWGVVTSISKWIRWVDTYGDFDTTSRITPPDGFLIGYRSTVTGFPIIQAIIEPLGIVIACVFIMHVVVKKDGAISNHMAVKS